jgi:hypothetical protein
MLLLGCVAALRALEPLMKQEMDYKSAYALYQLHGKLSAQAKFYSENELKLAKTYGKRDESGNLMIDEEGNFQLDGEGAALEYRDKRRELDRVEVDWTEDPITVGDIGKITPAQMAALAPFIEWEGSA